MTYTTNADQNGVHEWVDATPAQVQALAHSGGQVKDVSVAFDPKHDGKSKEEQSKLLDEEVERFNQFMTNLPDIRAQGPLLPQERMLLKTYLVHKLNGNLDRG